MNDNIFPKPEQGTKSKIIVKVKYVIEQKCNAIDVLNLIIKQNVKA